MAAGIVASTLRRRALRRKIALDAKYTAMEPGHISLSPTGSHPPSRSPSFMRASLSRSPSGASGNRSPRGTRLSYQDFWPQCVNPAEQNLRLVEFESFDTLIPKANAWLAENADVHLIKCETIEKKICSADDVLSDSPMFVPRNNYALYIKALRLWYIRDKEGSRNSINGRPPPVEVGYMNVIPKCLDSSMKYPIFENLPETYAAVNEYLQQSPLEGKILTVETVSLKLPRRHWDGPEVDPDQTYFPDEYLRHVLYVTRIYFVSGQPEEELIGAQDFLPDFVSAPRWYSIYGIYPKYMGLVTAMQKAKAWMIHARNVRVTNIQTLEAVYRDHPENVHTGVNFVDKIESCAMVRFIRVTFVRPAKNVDPKNSSYHPPGGFSYKTFIPCAVKVGMCSGAPEYESFSYTWERSRAWLKIVGMQDEHGQYIENTEKEKEKENERVPAGHQTNGGQKAQGGHKTGEHGGKKVPIEILPPPKGRKQGSYLDHPGLTMSELVAVAVEQAQHDKKKLEAKAHNKKGSEEKRETYDKRVIGAETFYHPLNRIWHTQDGGETTVMEGEWTAADRGNRKHTARRQLVHVVRVYLDSDYTEPPAHHLPPSPQVEEVNDCACSIQ